MYTRVLCFFLLMVFVSYGQSPSREGDLYMVIETANEEYGYINAERKVVIPFGKYPLCFTDTIKTIGFVLISKEGFWAIDKRENKLFRGVSLGNAPDRISEGLFRIRDDNGLMGFANMDGEVVIPPAGASVPLVPKSKKGHEPKARASKGLAEMMREDEDEGGDEDE